ncbi:hypothetical protein A2778_03555 [Candidatus Daviesbacteria bacterium RIFCSPHIGHO2_01_FULL_40_24]|nr:MAG: hypothetical protein A2778_03555 [Candidatus Daviesbacteria bacterium RIFCSPHIGHO2_01_FULL_40_24]OGE29725.1 MAG: hypothetical protein A3C29_06930 [Candidatus Daviesbacteria bacterium RIFCSPHIGHO2_02_FULL_40_16]OGE42678.1 MAG: hypothetical protein A3A53_03595 [Candidatus Daviesbacteria bacterium RIFCSPLOWO2_01_FULL_39_23]OGE67494.1 MAG: hypothetical protein A3J16_05970 [Candidatus Daviesbacteria bacterium RIFCSPLOWO2_02_FULL_39_13]HCE30681.1 hypothetical protein [Candidatus Daviesbacteri
MKSLKSSFRQVLILVFAAFIAISAVILIDNKFFSPTKQEGQVAGTQANPLLIDNKFCDNPETSAQKSCTSFIPSALAQAVTTYQNVEGDVAISGNIVNKLYVAGTQGGADNRNFKVTYSGGSLTGTEFSALTNLNNAGITGLIQSGYTGWTAMYAKAGSTNNFAGVFNGEVVVAGNGLTNYDRGFKVYYPNGGGLLNTEFSALTHLNNEGLSLSGWTAMYAKAGSASYAGIFNGNVRIHGTAWTTNGAWSGSDSRFKKDIEKINNPLDKLKMLEGITFNWRKDEFPQMNFTNGRQYGLIAQEVEKIIPELVNTDNQGYKSVAYDKFTAVLLEAIKQQQKQIDQLKKEVEDLKTK